jgi:hypothetical protein
LEERKKSKHFCFETYWTKHPDYHPKLVEIWGREVGAKNAVEKWYIKLNRMKKFLKGWGQNIKGQARRYKGILREELATLERKEEEESLPSQLLERKTYIQTELLRVSEEEELYWHKRSSQKWLLQGDSNTEFFHRTANGKKRKNLIFHLETDNSVLENETEILNHASNYYKNLFGPSDKPLFGLDAHYRGKINRGRKHLVNSTVQCGGS